MNTLISIITPCCRAEAFIERCVQSVLQQSYQNWEMLIVSDDGADYQKLLDTQGVCDERLRFLSSGGVQTGPNHSRNVALKQARGQWIAPLDADDVYYPDRLKQLLEATMQTGLALDNFYLVHSGKNQATTLGIPEVKRETFSLNDFLPIHRPLLFLFHRNLITQGWNTDIQRSADTVFNLRALEKAGYAALVNTPLHEYTVHGDSLCHCPQASLQFAQSYTHIVNRLNTDGLGFSSQEYKQQLLAYFAGKAQTNQAFANAEAQGFKGNFQDFLAMTC